MGEIERREGDSQSRSKLAVAVARIIKSLIAEGMIARSLSLGSVRRVVQTSVYCNVPVQGWLAESVSSVSVLGAGH